MYFLLLCILYTANIWRSDIKLHIILYLVFCILYPAVSYPVLLILYLIFYWLYPVSRIYHDTRLV